MRTICFLYACAALSNSQPACAASNEMLPDDARAAIIARNAEIRADPDRFGCIGKDAITCLASLGLSVFISSTPAGYGGYGEIKIPLSVEKDIYGKPTPKIISFLLSFTSNETSINDPSTINGMLHLMDGEHVTSVYFTLPSAPLIAKTEDDWNKTKVYNLASATLGGKCNLGEKLSFYKKYDYAQRSVSSGESNTGSYSNPGVSSGIGGEFLVCGISIRADSSSGITVDTGAYSSSSMTIAKP